MFSTRCLTQFSLDELCGGALFSPVRAVVVTESHVYGSTMKSQVFSTFLATSYLRCSSFGATFFVYVWLSRSSDSSEECESFLCRHSLASRSASRQRDLSTVGEAVSPGWRTYCEMRRLVLGWLREGVRKFPASARHAGVVV